MADNRPTIASLLAAEVADFSRLSASEDADARAAVAARLGQLRELVEKHEGRCLRAGDGDLIAAFSSPASAVRCAVETQQAIAALNGPDAAKEPVRLRIGLSLGELSVAEDSIGGEALDVAVGIRGLAVAGGVCLSGSIYEHVRHRVHVGFDLEGEKKLRGVPDPVPIYQVVEPGIERGYFSLWDELRRRNVFRVGAAYAVVAWLVIQAASIILPAFDTPPWGMQVLIALSIVGFPVALALAWAYEITPVGIKRSDEVLREGSIRDVAEKRLNFAIIAMLAVAVVFLVYDNYGRRELAGEEGPALDSIAVLAFENFSADPGDEYFADGLADELLSVLGRIRELKVASRTASFYFKGKDVDIGTIAETLQVGYVVSGGVRRYGDRIRVTAALDDPSSSDLLWSETFDREFADILEIQSSIARSVATAIVPVLSERSERQFMVPPTDSTEAYDFYLRGRDYLRRPGETATLASAIQLFERAIGLDAGFAHAYAGLCEAHLSDFYVTARPESFRSAELACERALSLDDSLWEVHVALGNLYRESGQYADAVVQLESAIAQQPSAVSPYLELAQVYAAQNLVVEAETLFERAQEVESGYWGVYNDFGNFLWHVYRYADAVPYYEKVIELVPDSGIGYDNLGVAYQALGDYEESDRALNAAPLPSRWTYSNRGLNNYYRGQFREAVDDYLRSIEIAPDWHISWGHLADSYRFIPGEEENARAAYERAIALAEADLEINRADWETLARLTTYYAYTGRREQALMGLDDVFELTSDPTAYYLAALASVALGDQPRALMYLEHIARSGWSRATLLTDPNLAVLSDDPRFQALMTDAAR